MKWLRRNLFCFGHHSSGVYSFYFAAIQAIIIIVIIRGQLQVNLCGSFDVFLSGLGERGSHPAPQGRRVECIHTGGRGEGTHRNVEQCQPRKEPHCTHQWRACVSGRQCIAEYGRVW